LDLTRLQSVAEEERLAMTLRVNVVERHTSLKHVVASLAGRIFQTWSPRRFSQVLRQQSLRSWRE
jgi:hypothetical protein